MNNPPEPLGRSLALASKATRGALDQALRAIGSSFSEYLVLRGADRCPGVTQRQLAGRVGIEGPTLTHHLDRLSRQGLLERTRQPDDRRAYAVTLTPTGQGRLARAHDVVTAFDAELGGLFSDAELTTLDGLLRRIRHHYDSSKAPHGAPSLHRNIA